MSIPGCRSAYFNVGNACLPRFPRFSRVGPRVLLLAYRAFPLLERVRVVFMEVYYTWRPTLFFFAAYKLQQQIRSVVSGCRTSERFMLPIRLSHSEIYIDPMIPHKLYLYCNTNTALLVTITCHRFAVLFFLGLFFSSGASTDELTTPTRLNLYEPCVVTPFFLAHCFMTAPPYRPNIDTQQKSPVPCTCPPFQQLHKLQTPSLPTPFLRQPPQQPP